MKFSLLSISSLFVSSLLFANYAISGDERQCGNNSSLDLSLLKKFSNETMQVVSKNQRTILQMENSCNFPLDIKQLAAGKIQMSLVIDNASAKDELPEKILQLDTKDILSKGNKIVAAKTAFLIDVHPDKVTADFFDSEEYYKKVYPTVKTVTTSEHESNFRCDRSVNLGPISICSISVYLQHLHSNNKSSALDSKLESALKKLDDDTIGFGPKHIFLSQNNHSSDSRFSGGQVIQKYYAVGDKTLVIIYRLASLNVSSFVYKMASGYINSQEKEETVCFASDLRKAFAEI